ncbi:MAG: hypothetical protein JRI89_01650 [Deltaproteobacteria bacterium]|nr:hypothetical protein [Deltaproteobacteria bacterium]
MKKMQQKASLASMSLWTLSRVFQFGGIFLLLSALIWGFSQPAAADGSLPLPWGWACSNTSVYAFIACKHEAKDDYWIARGNCRNISDRESRRDCMAEAKDSLPEAIQECRDQFWARLEVCDAIGEAPYDPLPEIDQNDFVLPGNITAANANPYFPLVRGYKWTYHTKEGDEITETTTDEVLKVTREIMGVQCVVVHDVVYDGDSTDPEDVKEDTYDWYAQDKEGNVWYFGEFSLDYEEELPSMEGSWIFGLEGAKPGIIMPADPVKGDVYRQEFSLGDAEDMAEILGVGVSPGSEVQGFECAGTCVKTRDYSPIEPDVVEYKFYKNGVGVVLERNPDTGERVELVDTNF